MKTYTVTLSAGVKAIVPMGGKFFMFMKGTAPIDVEFINNQSPNSSEKGTDVTPGYWTRLAGVAGGNAFDVVHVTSATAQTIQVGVTNVEGGFFGVEVNTASNVIDSNAIQTVSFGTPLQVASQNNDRRSITIRNLATNLVDILYVSDSDVDGLNNRGMPVYPGMSLTIETKSALWADSQGGNIDIQVEEHS